MNSTIHHSNGTRPDDVAIVGMSCIFPGAPNVATYWRNIVSKVDAVSDAPDDWGADIFFDPDSSGNDRTYCKRGGFLHDLASFDPLEYGVMPSSIDGGEPDHFLALRVAHEALADAGYRREGSGSGSISGDRVEVILGRGAYINRGFTNLVQHGLIVDQTLRLLRQLHPEHTDDELALLREELKASLPPFNPEMAPGLVPNILSGRIANRLDLMGPNFTIDAACASSLIAVERAIQDLQAGRCDMALTGGIQCTSPPPIFMVFCQLNALSRRGCIQPFSEDADGTLLGEGLGLIVLKRIGDAIRDGNRIYAVLKSVGSASDGRALGLLAPRIEGEELAMRRAYDAGNISPASIGLLEAHGTGTAVGDQTEVQALTRIFGLRNGRPPAMALGSVKSMISHLIPAAGIAGIIKAALSLYYKVLPPTLHCERPSPKLELERTPFYMNTETRPWVHGLATPRRAGVNAFGFGGINAHAILEEFVPMESANQPDGGPAWDSELILIRGENRAGVLNACRRLDSGLNHSASYDLKDLAYTLNCFETSGTSCLAIVASSIEDLTKKLRHSVSRLEDAGCRTIRDMSGIFFADQPLAGEGKVAFLFPGEGSQYLNMFSDLCLRLACVRERFDVVDRAFRDHPRGWLPSQVIFPPPIPNDPATRRGQEQRLESMDFAAESVFAASQGMLALLRKLEIEPAMIAGHSGGEICALLAAGAINITDETELVHHITEINELYTKLSGDGIIPEGHAFAVSGMERDDVLRVVQEHGAGFSVGMDNCPHQLILCGMAAGAGQLRANLSSAGGVCMDLPFQRPYHTPAFDPWCAHIRPFFDRLPVVSARIPVYCAATAGPFPDEPQEIKELASRQTSLPVRFRETLDAMHNDGARIFIEVGPKGVLTSFVADTLRNRAHLAVASDLSQVSGVQQMNVMLGQLAAHGIPMRLNYLYERRGAQKVSFEMRAAQSRTTPKRGIRLATGLTNMTLKDRPRKWSAPAASAAVAPLPVAPVPETVIPRGAVDDAPMHAWLDNMDRFLVVQREVMQAYLGHSSAATTAVAPPQPSTPHLPTPPTGPHTHNGHIRETVKAPVPPPAAVSGNGHSNGHGSPHARLLEVISDRTGYPVDMLAPDLNLEADLGIDSIKRIEILGAFHRQTGLIGPDRMERASAMKTLGEITRFLGDRNDEERNGDERNGRRHMHTGPSFPLTGAVDLHKDGMSASAVREFDTTQDLFLNDHALGGRVSSRDPGLTGLPLVPMTMAVELMAEVAASLAPGETLTGMRDVRMSRWLFPEEGRLRLRTTARRLTPNAAILVEVFKDGDAEPAASAVAIFGDRYPDPPTPPQKLVSTRPSKWTPERLYRDHMFHGPAFRGIRKIHDWSPDGLTTTVRSLPSSSLFKNSSAPSFLTDPVLVDAAGQMIGYWAAEHLKTGFNVFPCRIESLDFYGAQLPQGSESASQSNIREVGDSRIVADLYVTDSTQRVRVRAMGWEDVRVDIPDSLYRMFVSPRGVFLSSPVLSNPLLGNTDTPSANTVICSIDVGSLPLTAFGGIWLRALAQIVLSAKEREDWRDLAGAERRRIEWLLGRCCAKDAVRLLAKQFHESDLLPADVVITPDETGRPYADAGNFNPAISISHADGAIFAAAAAEPGTAIGIDVQRIDSSRDDFEVAAFNEDESALLDRCDPATRRETALRFWCAKESAMKALGYGIAYGPGSVVVRSFDSGGTAGLEIAGALAQRVPGGVSLVARTSRIEDLVVAVCRYPISTEDQWEDHS